MEEISETPLSKPPKKVLPSALSVQDQIESLKSNRLYNVRLDKTPKLSNAAKENNISNNRIFSILFCMGEILPKDVVWIDFIDRIDTLLIDYAQVDKNKLGFPDDWQELLKKV